MRNILTVSNMRNKNYEIIRVYKPKIRVKVRPLTPEEEREIREWRAQHWTLKDFDDLYGDWYAGSA